MDREDTEGHAAEESDAPKQESRDLIPREYLRLIAVWSLVPSYAIAGGLLGYLLDTWLDTFPYLTGLGLLLALVLAVRDIYRLRGAL